MSPQQNLGELRTGVDSAVAENVAAQARVARARELVDRARMSGVGDAAAAQAELDAASQAASESHAALEQSRSSLHDALLGHLGAIGVFEAIAPASVPVALLPVGLETRFAGDELLVRVLPDEIHVEDHEPELSDSEVEAGRAFWVQAWRGGTAEPAATEAEQAAWVNLVKAIGSSRRAAWIADRTAPTGGNRPAAPVPAGTDLPDPLVFPEPARRAGAWSRPAVARTLPDHFVAIAYRKTGSGGQASWTEIARGTGTPVSDSVQLGLDPGAPAPAVTDTGPALPDGMQWMIDPAAAEAAGLLVRIPLPPGTARIDRLVVLGVLGSLEAAAASTRLADLLANHHYSRGLEVLPVGTPTNNTAAERSGFATPDDAVASFAIERRVPAPADGSDGALFARALGIAADTLRGIANAGTTEQSAAGQMNALVWPSAFGYWFDSLVQPGPSDSVIADIRGHAVQMVRGRGPLPPLRVGRQPYGVLPVTSLRTWQPASEPPGVVHAAQYLRSALPWWLDGVLRAPVVRAGADPDQGILDVLSQSPVSSTVAVRSMVGANACFIPFAAIAGIEQPAAEANRQRWLALLGFRALGITGMPYIGQLVGARDPVPLLQLPYTVDPRTPPDQAAAAWQAITTYLDNLRLRSTRDLQAEDPRGFTSLLTLLAKRSVMLERVRAGVLDTKGVTAGTFVEAHLRIDNPAVVEAQMISTTATLRIGDTRSTTAAFLAGTVQQDDGSQLAAIDHIDRNLVLGVIDTTKHAAYAETLAAAEAVAQLAPDRAALLLGEALDVSSHRFDAWVTSLATRRLSDLRAATPTGVTLGAYGVVEELTRREPRPAVAQPPATAPVPLVSDTSGGGYVHAPSLAQAATAAVLRAGHLSHATRDPNTSSLAVDLSSSRVRMALGLLDGVRQGQSLGALLGYRTERLLHERGAHVSVEVVRALAPPPMVTADDPSPEGLPPRAVCDGLALSRLPRADVVAKVQAEAPAEAGVIDGVLDTLLDAVDAVADLLLAESVHQIVRGNPARAAGALDALNRGEGATAEPEVVATPRTGTSITTRALLLIGAEPSAAPGWRVDGVRAQAEPRLAAWAGHMLGDPTGVEVRVRAGAATTTIALMDLGLGALDVVYEPLAPRALRHARGLGVGEGASLDLAEPKLASLLAAAEGVRGLLTRARAGDGLDLGRPQDRGSTVSGPPPLEGAGALSTALPDVDGGDRRGRLDAARARLAQAVTDLAGVTADGPLPAEATVVGPLDTFAQFGIAPGGDPAQPPSAASIVAVREAAAARLAGSQVAADDASALFGEGFPVLALAAPPFPAALATALASNPLAGDRDTLDAWVESYGRVRPGIGRLADVLLASRLRRTGGPSALRAIQQPVEAFPSADPTQRGQWVGLPFPAPLDPTPVTSFVAHTLGELDANRGVAVLVLDEHIEVVPAAETTTAISFGFDAPGARPPQTILLAVPPVPGAGWTVDSLAGVIGETVDLAKIRMVDLSAVAWAGRFVPTIYLTDGDVAGGLDLPMRDLVSLANARAQAMVDL